MKELARYLTEHAGQAIMILAGLLLVWLGASAFPPLGQTNYGLVPVHGPQLPTSTPTTIKSYQEPGDPSVPAGCSAYCTPTPSPWMQGITTLGQYCQDGRSYTNFKIELPGDITIMEGAYDSASMPTLPADAAGGGLIPLPIISSAGSSVAFIPPEMRCVLMKEDPDSALFNCTGLENSIVPIFVGGVPVDVYFMGCGGNDPKQDEECARRDCRYPDALKS